MWKISFFFRYFFLTRDRHYTNDLRIIMSQDDILRTCTNYTGFPSAEKPRDEKKSACCYRFAKIIRRHILHRYVCAKRVIFFCVGRVRAALWCILSPLKEIQLACGASVVQRYTRTIVMSFFAISWLRLLHRRGVTLRYKGYISWQLAAIPYTTTARNILLFFRWSCIFCVPLDAFSENWKESALHTRGVTVNASRTIFFPMCLVYRSQLERV